MVWDKDGSGLAVERIRAIISGSPRMTLTDETRAHFEEIEAEHRKQCEENGEVEIPPLNLKPIVLVNLQSFAEPMMVKKFIARAAQDLATSCPSLSAEDYEREIRKMLEPERRMTAEEIATALDELLPREPSR